MRMTTVTVVNLHESEVYIVLGIDENAHDQVLAVFCNYSEAKRYCSRRVHDTPFYDLWIEKHPVM